VQIGGILGDEDRSHTTEGLDSGKRAVYEIIACLTCVTVVSLLLLNAELHAVREIEDS
jgi:hypothetical protein